MDPTEALAELLDALDTLYEAEKQAQTDSNAQLKLARDVAQQSREEACERLSDLLEWLKLRGFAPDVQSAMARVVSE